MNCIVMSDRLAVLRASICDERHALQSIVWGYRTFFYAYDAYT